MVPPLAVSVAPLVRHQDGKTPTQAELETAAAVPGRRGAVAVEENHQGRAGVPGVVFAGQTQAVP